MRHVWLPLLALALVAVHDLTARAAVDPPMTFVDITLEAGIDFVETIGDDVMSNIVESAGVGCGLFDYDGDGHLDIYLVNGHWKEGLSDPDLYEEERQPDVTDRLYRSLGDGRFEDVTEAVGVANVAYGMAVISADYDSDGDADIYVTNYGPNFLYRNEGDGTFTEVAEEAGVADPSFGGGVCIFDYDGDGILDLYLGNYVEYDPDYSYYYAPDGFPGPLAYAGQQDRLFRGKGDGTFEDVTVQAGIDIEPVGRAMGVGGLDYDNDGRVDVFVSNDAMENFLLHNLGNGRFENVALVAGVAFGGLGEVTAAMAAEPADFDNDGLVDLFVPDIEYSCLYQNLGGGDFSEQSAVSGIANVCGQYTSWGSAFADFDLDGAMDLYVSNGDVHHLEADEDLLFKGDGKGNFTDVSATAGAWAFEKYVSRGVARGDIDNDGDIDLLVASLDDRPVLLRNDTPRRGRHWIGIELAGRGPNRDAIGALVKVTTGKTTRVRHRMSAGSYLSQHDARIHFGLGSHDEPVQLEVVWPDGSVLRVNDVEVDRYHLVRQETASRAPSPSSAADERQTSQEGGRQ